MSTIAPKATRFAVLILLGSALLVSHAPAATADAAHSSAAQATSSKPTVTLHANKKAAAPNTDVRFKLYAKHVEAKSPVYLQVLTGGRWKVAQSGKLNSSRSANFTQAVGSGEADTYRVALMNGRRLVFSNRVTVATNAAPTDGGSTGVTHASAPITEGQRAQAVANTLDYINALREQKGLTDLVLADPDTMGVFQDGAESYYKTGEAPSATNGGCFGTDNSLVGAKPATDNYLRPDGVSIAIGYYYDQNGAFDGDNAGWSLETYPR